MKNLPDEQELSQIAQRVKGKVDARVAPWPRWNRRRGAIGGLAAIALIGGGVAAGAAIGSGGDRDPSRFEGNGRIDLGRAPKDARYVWITLRVACKPGDVYRYGLNGPDNPAGVECQKTDSRGTYDETVYTFEIAAGASVNTADVTTNSDTPYYLEAKYSRWTIFPNMSEMSRRIGDPDAPFDVNEHGLTYGFITEDDLEAGNLPDLIRFATDADEAGFVKRADFERWLRREGPQTMTVYDVDGVTKMGHTDRDMVKYIRHPLAKAKVGPKPGQ
jgi:hypothetical protein